MWLLPNSARFSVGGRDQVLLSNKCIKGIFTDVLLKAFFKIMLMLHLDHLAFFHVGRFVVFGYVLLQILAVYIKTFYKRS